MKLRNLSQVVNEPINLYKKMDTETKKRKYDKLYKQRKFYDNNISYLSLTQIISLLLCFVKSYYQNRFITQSLYRYSRASKHEQDKSWWSCIVSAALQMYFVFIICCQLVMKSGNKYVILN